MEKFYLKKNPLNKEGKCYEDFYFNVLWNQFEQIKKENIKHIPNDFLFVSYTDGTYKKSRSEKLLEEFKCNYLNKNEQTLQFKIPNVVNINDCNILVLINPSKFLFDSKISRKFITVYDPLNEKLHLLDKKIYEENFRKFKIGSVLKKENTWKILSKLNYKEVDVLDLQKITEIVSENLFSWEKKNTIELCTKCRKECKQNLGFELFKCSYFKSTKGRK